MAGSLKPHKQPCTLPAATPVPALSAAYQRAAVHLAPGGVKLVGGPPPRHRLSVRRLKEGAVLEDKAALRGERR